jgi:hypothetical protein
LSDDKPARQPIAPTAAGPGDRHGPTESAAGGALSA